MNAPTSQPASPESKALKCAKSSAFLGSNSSMEADPQSTFLKLGNVILSYY